MDTASNNAYGIARATVMERYSNALSGAADGLALAVCSKAPSPTVSAALTASFARLGYADGPTYLLLSTQHLPEDDDIRRCIEGIDPLTLVALDADAAAKVAQAYHREFPIDRISHVFGHASCAFTDFEASLGDDTQKQRCWALLKCLPHLSDAAAR